MRNSKIKALFEKAEEQIQVDEIRKQETYNMMLETMEKQRTPMMSIKNILLHQIWYMDKVFFIIYGVTPVYNFINGRLADKPTVLKPLS